MSRQILKPKGSDNQDGFMKPTPNFKRCPSCRASNLVKFDVDFFCMDCDWNSILFDVYSGNFEKRIGIMNRKTRERAKDKATVIENGVVHLDDLGDDNVTFLIEPTESTITQKKKSYESV